MSLSPSVFQFVRLLVCLSEVFHLSFISKIVRINFKCVNGLIVADTQLYKGLCPLVHWAVGSLVRCSVMIVLNSAKTRIFDAAVVIVCVIESVCCGRGCGLGLHASAHPSKTIL